MRVGTHFRSKPCLAVALSFALIVGIAPAGAQPLDCLDGTVDLGGSSTPANVLAINGGAGDVNHVVTADLGESIAVSMSVAPSGPNPATFALYVWLGEPSGETVTPHPRNLGDMCFPTPLTGGVPQPRKIWNNIGKFPKLGYPDFPSDLAPCVVFVKPQGIPSDLAVTFQGLLLDNGSAADVPASVTNGVILRVSDIPDPEGMAAIPAGEFLMGCHSETGEPCTSDELPVHAVHLNAFWMDICKVTNQQYADALNWAWSQGGRIQVTGGVVHKYGSTSTGYCDTTTSSSGSRITWNGSTFGVVAAKEDHPMVDVSWWGAAAYGNWRSAMEGRTPCYDTTTWECNFDANGYRLPTEAEWEYAARGGHLDPYTTYPWGNAIDGSNANYKASGDPFEVGPYPWTTPVGYYDGGQTPPGPDMANGYGLYDMAGDVWEWCNDWYSSTYYGSSPYENPRGPASGTSRVLRGGSWDFIVDHLRCANRLNVIPVDRNDASGFRVVLD